MSAIRAWRLRADRVIRGEVCGKAGDVVYALKGYDYGCASDDTRILGVAHTSVTLDPAGDYPFFTVPVGDMEEVKTAHPSAGEA